MARDNRGRFTGGGGGGPRGSYKTSLMGMKKFLRALDRAVWKRKIDSEFGRKLKEQLELVRGDIISYIRNSEHGVPNALITQLWKGSSKPLIDRGDLFDAVTSLVKANPDGLEGGVGVLRQAKGGTGEPLVNVAKALHEGFVVNVTPKVRAAIMAKVRKRAARRGQKIPELRGPGATHYRVKGRPFVKVPFEKAEPRIRMALGDALKLVIQGL